MAKAPFRRPAMLDLEFADQLEGDIDPADRALIAHETAAAIVNEARESRHPELVARLIALVDEEGLETVAMLWSKAEALTLPGALWRLYMLREWVKCEAVGVAKTYHFGVAAAHVRHEVVGVEDPPTPDEVRALADEVLSGVFSGDLAHALERAGAFCRVVALGTEFEAEGQDPALSQARTHQAALKASQLTHTGEELERCGEMWRKGRLD